MSEPTALLAAGTRTWAQQDRPSLVKTSLTPDQTPDPTPDTASGRSRPVVENDEYARFVARVVTAYGRRVGSGDIEGLRDLVLLDALVHACTRTAITGLRAEGYSWSEIADRLGTTRQAAHQRWGGGRS